MRDRFLTIFVVTLALTTQAAAQSGPWHELTLHAFQGSTDGVYPSGGLAPYGAGFIGETAEGGTYGTGTGGLGYGTIFMLAAPAQPGGLWTKSTVYDFALGEDGATPAGGLLAGPDGTFFGTTDGNNGTVFQLSPPGSSGDWTLTTLYTFPSSGGGKVPQGGLIFDAKSNLYGVTEAGGTSRDGIVYELSPPAQTGGPWVETTLHNFTGGEDGKEPYGGLVMDAKGAIYGTTFRAGGGHLGTVFRLEPPTQVGGAWAFTTLWTFSGSPADGSGPEDSLIFDSAGNLYGTTNTGGAFSTYGYGTIFELSPPASGVGPWTESIIHSFQGSDGAYPAAGLVWGKGAVLYGTTQTAAPGAGVVFSLTPPNESGNWTEAVLYTFPAGAGRGANLMNKVVIAPSGALYSTSYVGGQGAYGTAFEVHP